MTNEHFEQLYSFLLTMAEKLLNKNREIYPLAARQSLTSEITPLAIYGGDEHAPSQEVLADLSPRYLRQKPLLPISPHSASHMQ
jgi:hypothetical protein